MSGWIGVVPGSEVPVEGRDDGVLLSFLHVLPKGRHTAGFSILFFHLNYFKLFIYYYKIMSFFMSQNGK